MAPLLISFVRTRKVIRNFDVPVVRNRPVLCQQQNIVPAHESPAGKCFTFCTSLPIWCIFVEPNKWLKQNLISFFLENDPLAMDHAIQWFTRKYLTTYHRKFLCLYYMCYIKHLGISLALTRYDCYNYISKM